MKFLDLFRVLPPWRKAVYVVVTVAMFGLLVWDIVDREAWLTTVGFFVLVLIATATLRAPTHPE